MTVKLTTVKLAGGQQLTVEVDEPAAVGVRAVALTEKGEIDFAAALEHVRAAASQLQAALASAVIPPKIARSHSESNSAHQPASSLRRLEPRRILASK
jgi:hypothetical protein